MYKQDFEIGRIRPETSKSAGGTNTRKLERRPSRGSSAAFNNMDVDFCGNHNSINHLIKPRVASGTNQAYHPTTLGQVNFEVGLRHY